jgi:DNA-binding winged helix-turn-helix (wHTH) protein
MSEREHRRFRVGDIVYVKAHTSLRGQHRVVALLPHNGRCFEYRVKHPSESVERICPESHLRGYQP